MLILNKYEADAVYGAMVTLNNVGGILDCRLDDTRVHQTARGKIVVEVEGTHLKEEYSSQHDFAASYGLD